MSGEAEDLASFAAREAELEEYRRTVASLNRQLIRAKAKTDDLVAAVYRAAKDALVVAATSPVPAPAHDARRHKPEVALWHLSDWQGAKLTSSYNTDVMRARVRLFVSKAKAITEIQRQDHPVRDAALLLGGDMLEGLFNFPTQPFEIDATLFHQWANVSELLIETVRAALGIYERVTVVAEWGNHGRIGNKRAAVPRADNLDRMCYEHARRRLADEKRLTWQDCPEDIQRVEIGNYRALLIHGDEIGRNGYASPMTIVAHASKWKSGAYPWAFRDLYLGHYHNHAEWALPDGEGAVYQTGSTESDNRYALVGMAASSIPSQRLHFVDPERGRITAQYKVLLDEATR